MAVTEAAETAEAAEARLAEQARHLDMVAEIEAMRRAWEVLRKLDDRAKRRAMRWPDTAIWDPEEPPF